MIDLKNQFQEKSFFACSAIPIPGFLIGEFSVEDCGA